MSDTSPSIDSVWARIKTHEGYEFKTKDGRPFTYAIQGEILRSSRANRNIPKSDFAKALALVPLPGPGAIQ